jgi:hypothetical protein
VDAPLQYKVNKPGGDFDFSPPEWVFNQLGTLRYAKKTAFSEKCYPFIPIGFPAKRKDFPS